jgi:hypothetical protein
MLALDPANNYSSVDVVTFGGQNKDYDCPKPGSQLAGRLSYRLRISWVLNNGEALCLGLVLGQLPYHPIKFGSDQICKDPFPYKYLLSAPRKLPKMGKYKKFRVVSATFLCFPSVLTALHT